MGIVVICGNEHVVNAGFGGCVPKSRYQSTTNTAPLTVCAHRDVIDENLRGLLPRHWQDVRGQAPDDLISCHGNESPKVCATEQLLHVTVTQERLGFIEHGRHESKRTLRDFSVG